MISEVSQSPSDPAEEISEDDDCDDGDGVDGEAFAANDVEAAGHHSRTIILSLDVDNQSSSSIARAVAISIHYTINIDPIVPEFQCCWM